MKFIKETTILLDLMNNTIEERVSLLEVQVADLREDVTVVQGDVVDLDQDVNFLFDETVIQDARLFTLEQMTDTINVDLVSVDDELEGEDSTTKPRKYRK